MKKLYYKIANWLLLKSSPCTNIVASISERFDRNLSITETIQMRTHMKFCHCCTRYKKQIDYLHDAIGSKMKLIQNSSEFSEKLSPERSNKIKTLLKEQMSN